MVSIINIEVEKQLVLVKVKQSDELDLERSEDKFHMILCRLKKN